MKVLHREVAIVRSVEPQHAFDLLDRRPPARRLADPPIAQPLDPLLAQPVAMTAERPLAHPQQLRRFPLAQFAPLVAIQQRLESHYPDLLKRSCPAHQSLPFGAIQKPDKSRVTKTGQITS